MVKFLTVSKSTKHCRLIDINERYVAKTLSSKTKNSIKYNILARLNLNLPVLYVEIYQDLKKRESSNKST